MELHHLGKPYRSSSREPSSWEIHLLEFVSGRKDPGLAMGERDGGFAVSPHLIHLNVLPRTLVEMFLKGIILFTDGSCHGPHDVAQTHGWPHAWCEVHRREKTGFMDDWNRGVNLGKVNVVPITGLGTNTTLEGPCQDYLQIIHDILWR
jgi:hypothetical protein